MAVANRDLFLGFLRIGLMGFGGVAAIARHMIVEKLRWLDEREYAVLLGLGQALPGANVTNLAIILGMRNGGTLGVLSALGGLLVAPILILVGLATFYAHTTQYPVVSSALAAMASVAGGVMVGTGLKMVIRAKMDWRGGLIALTGFVAIVLAQFSMIYVLLILLPVSVLLFLVTGGRT